MKLHRNRKDKNNMKRFICLALALCLTFSMGSSYVSAGEMNTPGENTAGPARSLDDLEVVPVQTGGADGQTEGQNSNNIEGTPSDMGQQTPADGGQGIGDASGAGQQTPTDGSQGTGDASGADQQIPSDGGQGTGNAPGADQQTPTDGSQGTGDTSGAGQQNPSDGGQGISGNQGQQTPANGSQGSTTAPDAGQQNPSGAGQGTSGTGTATDTNQQNPSGAGQGTPGTGTSAGAGQQTPADGTQGQGTLSGIGSGISTDAAQPPADTVLPGTDSAELIVESSGNFANMEEFSAAPNDAAYNFTAAPANLDGSDNTPVQNPQWSFDTYYVNEADKYSVTKTDDFSLKYQMEFHTSDTFPAGSIKVRIDGALLQYRPVQGMMEGAPAVPSDIGVPAASWDENGSLVPNPSRSTSFNYYYENEDGSKKQAGYSPDAPYLVFYNYKEVAAGTNAAWQVLYSNLKIMDIRDETTWNKKAQISVNGGAAYTDGNPFTGRVNSSVSLTSAVKTPYYESGKKYTPGLYTVSQLKSYVSNVKTDSNGIDYIGDTDYITTDGKLNTQKYRFVVWDVKITGKATQPWSLYIEDIPTAETDNGPVEGTVVGYKDHSDTTTSYNFPINAPDSPNGQWDGKVSNSDNARTSALKKSWGHRFWVVTAYPADSVLPGDAVKNDITVRLEPADGIDQDEILAATPASWDYRDYDWHYEGDVISTGKWNGWGSRNDTTEYTGWLEAYRRASQMGDDYGDIPFTVKGHMKGYDKTHYVTGTNLGEYIENTSYSLTTADDFLYLQTGSTLTPMGKGDYYFSSVTVEQKDNGYDIYDDKLVKSQRAELVKAGKLSDDFGKVEIYAMFAKDANGNALQGNGTADNEWELVTTVAMDEEGKAGYSFTPEQIAREPYRVKAVHESVDYSTDCTIKVAVRLKAESADSGVMQSIMTNHDIYNESPKIMFENLSGAMGTWKESDGTLYHVYADEDTSAGTELEGGIKSETSFNYGDRSELADKTTALYGGLLVRQNAVRTATWLETAAKANKKYSAKNDAANNRVLVDYYLTAYDGYLIYDKSCLDYMTRADEALITPGRKHVVFYDLLPYGMQFDASTAVTAGRIKELDTQGNYMESPRSWDSTQVSVTVDPDRDIVKNYKGTGRTMVAFHIAYSGADPAVYTNGKWAEGWGVSFRAYYDWKNMDSVNKDANANLVVFMPDFSVKDEINEKNPVLYGQTTQVYADNGEMTTMGEAYKDLLLGDNRPEHKGNIDGNMGAGYLLAEYKNQDGTCKYDKDGDTWNRNVLYADTTVNDNVATSSESSIQKLVRADSDQYGAFRDSAMVEKGGNYTYEITVSAEQSSAIQGIAVFDRLENAGTQTGGTSWQGTFRGVDLSALTKQGITADVYCNDNRNAAIPTGNQDPAGILIAENGWYQIKKEENQPEKGWYKVVDSNGTETEDTTWKKEDVKAVAVVFAPDYQLPELHTASFQIQMTAPAAVTEGTYACNEASFSSYPVGKPEKRAAVTGKNTRVGVNDREQLEIIKRTSGVVPTALQNTEFAFRVYEKNGQNEEEKLAFLAYSLYKEDRDGSWIPQNSQPHATDENGYLYLKAGEKAVFSVVDADRIMVEETANVFWDTTPASAEAARSAEERYTETAVKDETTGETAVTRTRDDNGNIHVRTWINTFRPVVYVQKKLNGVPQDVQKQLNEITNAGGVTGLEFTFKLWVKKGNDYVPASDAQFWYVDSVLTDGGIPARVNRDNEPWTAENGKDDPKKTGSDGTFTIKPGQIIALFPGLAGTEYKITEENLDSKGYSDNGNGDWYCTGPEVKGTVVSEGSSRTITNYYRWKELNLTKEITHLENTHMQDATQCTQPFTFRIMELELGPDGKPLTDAAGNVIEAKKQKIDAAGNVVTDNDGNPVMVSATAGLEWELRGAQTPTENPVPVEGLNAGNSSQVPSVGGTLDDNGAFTCAFAGRTVRIKNLEAGKYYMVKEMPVSPDEEEGVVLYQPVKDSEQFKILPVSTKKDITFINDYLKRPLTVKKTVTGDKNPTNPNPAFVFEVKVNGQLLPNGISYTVTKQGEVIRSGVMGKEENTGAEIENFVDETIDSEGNIVPAKFAEGKFTLHDGEIITFEEAGILGQTFEVKETDRKGYTQLYPNPTDHDGIASDTFKGEGGEASFVNGSSSALYISKEYVTDETESLSHAVKVINKWKQWIERLGSPAINRSTGEEYTEYILEVTDERGTYIWPRYDTKVTGINQLNGKEVTCDWEAGKSIRLQPWIMFSIPVGEGENAIPETASYTLTEVESSQKRIIKFNPDSSESDYVQVTQSYPADGGSISGTVQSDPTATIVNKLTSLDEFTGSKVGKRMTSASATVPTGEKLVWRLEKYDSAAKKWNPWTPEEPKEGEEEEVIKYVVFKEDGTPISNEVLTVEPGGKIVLEKPAEGYPEVWFVNKDVYINLYDPDTIAFLESPNIGVLRVRNLMGDGNENPEETAAKKTLYRLVEVPEESGKEWGLLAGYGINKTQYSWTFNLLSYFGKTFYFFNSNSKSSIEIEKYTEKRSYQEFTMILEQVVAINGSVGDVTGENYDSKLVCEPRGGIQYTIHNADGTPIEAPNPARGVTGPGGEIKLRAGQYVILDVPEGTVWTVSEDTYATPNYDLKDLEETQPVSGKVVKLTDNLMLINLPIPFIRYTLRFDANGGTVEPTTMVQESDAEEVTFDISGVVPTREGYIFRGWWEVGGPTWSNSVTLTSEEPTKTLQAIWEKAWTAKVVFQDSSEGELITVETIVPMGENAKVTAITAEEAYADKPELLQKYKDERYIFKGWKTYGGTIYEPGTDITIEYDKDNIENTLYRTAVWEKTKTCVVQYHDTWEGTDYGNAFSYNEIPESQEVYAETVANAYNIPNDTTNPPMSSVPDARQSGWYVFLGWSKTEGARKPDYQPGESLEIPSNGILDLYAVWTVWGYSVTWSGNGKKLSNGYKQAAISGICTGQSYYEANTSVSGTDGNILLGWSEDPDATEPQYKVGEPIILYPTDDGRVMNSGGTEYWRVEKKLYAVWK